MAAASTDDHFRDDNKGGYSHGRGPIFPVKQGRGGPPLYREDGAGGSLLRLGPWPHLSGKLGLPGPILPVQCGPPRPYFTEKIGALP